MAKDQGHMHGPTIVKISVPNRKSGNPNAVSEFSRKLVNSSFCAYAVEFGQKH